jgi:hypothetical protein
MNPLRRAILVLLIPAAIYVYLHSALTLANAQSTFLSGAYQIAWNEVLTRPGFWESEGLVVALAAIAWALTGRAKRA